MKKRKRDGERKGKFNRYGGLCVWHKERMFFDVGESDKRDCVYYSLLSREFNEICD